MYDTMGNAMQSSGERTIEEGHLECPGQTVHPVHSEPDRNSTITDLALQLLGTMLYSRTTLVSAFRLRRLWPDSKWQEYWWENRTWCLSVLFKSHQISIHIRERKKEKKKEKRLDTL